MAQHFLELINAQAFVRRLGTASACFESFDVFGDLILSRWAVPNMPAMGTCRWGLGRQGARRPFGPTCHWMFWSTQVGTHTRPKGIHINWGGACMSCWPLFHRESYQAQQSKRCSVQWLSKKQDQNVQRQWLAIGLTCCEVATQNSINPSTVMLGKPVGNKAFCTSLRHALRPSRCVGARRSHMSRHVGLGGYRQWLGSHARRSPQQK